MQNRNFGLRHLHLRWLTDRPDRFLLRKQQLALFQDQAKTALRLCALCQPLPVACLQKQLQVLTALEVQLWPLPTPKRKADVSSGDLAPIPAPPPPVQPADDIDKSRRLFAATNTGDSWEVTDEETYIGRSKQCTIGLKSQRVSRKHASCTTRARWFLHQ